MKRFLILLFSFCISFLPLQAIPWQKPEFYYFSQDEDIPDMLRNFCLSQGINAVISPHVKGTVSGLFENVMPDDFLNQICKAYGLIWFYDGNVLYIDPFDTITSQLVQVQYYDANKLLQMLQALGIEGSNFSLKSLDSQGLMLVSGSPRFVGMTYDILGKLEDNEKMRQGRLEVGVYPLKNAWAYDMKLKYLNTAVTVPGIASTINNLMAGGKLPSVGGSTESAPQAVAKEKMQRLDGTKATMAKNQPESALESGPAASNQKDAKKKNENSDTVIQPDVRLNAVVVRDLREKLPLYEKLIWELDKPVSVINISAAIVDINTGYSRKLGNKFVSGEKDDHTYSVSTDGAVAPPATLDAGDLPEVGATAGFNFSGSFPVNGANFLAQVQMLEKDGYAKTLSRPSVMTLDNVEAIIANSSTVYIDVTSDRDASLFEIDGGTILQVTPHIIEENGVRKIKLLISIQDTTATIDTATGRPSKQGIQISTQAVILEGESLLIGGLYTDAKNNSYAGVPFLSRIPVLGYLFKVDSREKSVRERMFLITPKIITMASGDPESYLQFFSERLYDKEGTLNSFNNTDFTKELKRTKNP